MANIKFPIKTINASFSQKVHYTQFCAFLNDITNSRTLKKVITAACLGIEKKKKIKVQVHLNYFNAVTSSCRNINSHHILKKVLICNFLEHGATLFFNSPTGLFQFSDISMSITMLELSQHLTNQNEYPSRFFAERHTFPW